MTSLPFQGNGFAMSSDGLAQVARSLGVYAPEIWAVLQVETSGCGYLPDRRPQILFERHVFHRLTKGRFDDGRISAPTPGGYGPSGAPQYDRLAAAIALNRDAALQSASWGIGQIMGENFQRAGFATVEEMVAAMGESEDQQLAAIGAFLMSRGLHRALQAHDWTTFARGYNGPNFAINRYDIKLNAEFQRCCAGALPDLSVRAAQLYLTYLGFHPGPADGVEGARTLSALAEFQAAKGIAKSETINEECLSQLAAALRAAQAAAV